MAVYTVEVRTICEQQYLTNLQTSDISVLHGKTVPFLVMQTADDVLSWDIPIWESGSAISVKSAILQHYWMREIGLETVGLWKYHIQTLLQEIMPWYVDLHERLDAMHDIFLNQNGNETITDTYGKTIQKSGTDTREVSSTSKDTGTRDIDTSDTGTVDNNGTNDTHAENLVSDTPQNGLQDVIQGKYLSNAEVASNTNTVDNVETRNLQGSSKELRDLTMTNSGMDSITFGNKDTHGGEDIRKVLREGFSGDKVDVLARYYQLHLNIMQMIIKDVAKCFMGVY